MKAAVCRAFGGPEVVRIEDVPKPSPKPGEVLIAIRAATVSMADYRTRSRDLPKGLGFLAPIALGVFRPRHPILGMDLSGVIEAVGAGVSAFKPGDEVIALPGFTYGGHAEYIAMSATGAIAAKPRNLSFEEAAALPFGGGTIAAMLDQAPIKAGAEVLVNGASSATGTAAVQLAKALGATVTAVTSGGNAELVRSLGADQVIDYTSADFSTAGKTYDVIIDCVGNAGPARSQAALKPGGVLMPVASNLKTMLAAGKFNRSSGKTMTSSSVKVSAANLALLTRLAEAGQLRAVIDRTYDLAQIVDAHSYVDSGRKKGNVVLRIATA